MSGPRSVEDRGVEPGAVVGDGHGEVRPVRPDQNVDPPGTGVLPRFPHGLADEDARRRSAPRRGIDDVRHVDHRRHPGRPGAGAGVVSAGGEAVPVRSHRPGIVAIEVRSDDTAPRSVSAAARVLGDRSEGQRQPGDVLHGPVVELTGQASALRGLGVERATEQSRSRRRCRIDPDEQPEQQRHEEREHDADRAEGQRGERGRRSAARASTWSYGRYASNSRASPTGCAPPGTPRAGGRARARSGSPARRGRTPRRPTGPCGAPRGRPRTAGSARRPGVVRRTRARCRRRPRASSGRSTGAALAGEGVVDRALAVTRALGSVPVTPSVSAGSTTTRASAAVSLVASPTANDSATRWATRVPAVATAAPPRTAATTTPARTRRQGIRPRVVGDRRPRARRASGVPRCPTTVVRARCQPNPSGRGGRDLTRSATPHARAGP